MLLRRRVVRVLVALAALGVAGEGWVQVRAARDVRWSASLGTPIDAGPIEVGDRVYIGSSYKIACLARSTGKTIWERDANVAAGPVRIGDAAFVVLGTGTVAKLDAAHASPQPVLHLTWQPTKVIASGDGSPGLVAAGDQIEAIDTARRTLTWSRAPDYPDHPDSRFMDAAAGAGLVVASYRNAPGSADGSVRVYALDARRGKTLWSRSLPCRTGPFGSSGAVSVAGKLVAVQDPDFRIVGLDAMTGETLWEQPLGREDPVNPSEVLVTPDGSVYVSEWHGCLSALDGATGAGRWRVRIADKAPARPCLDGDRVYAASGPPALVELRAVDGTTVREVRFESALASLVDPYVDYAIITDVSDDTIYLRSADGGAWAVNRAPPSRRPSGRR